MNIAIIPARGGSKRIPRKNIKDFCGKPIIAYSIETALESGLFDKVIVSTDDEEIAEVARKYGAECPFMRPKELADDFIGTNAVVKHTVEWYKSCNITISNVCLIYATSPLLTKETLQTAQQQYNNSDCDIVFCAVEYDFPIWRALKPSSNGNVTPIFEQSINKRSQDLPQAIHDAGQFYWGKPNAFKLDSSIFNEKCTPYLIPSFRAQDIDTLNDWKKAELAYRLIND
ncbi:pseudaminic acid cytidylyltransferase [Psychrobium sp. MM17-31]|uniref:pseudaminic acid cytidylyltransferase n=1 Tax=Psychrobium sp. MM17-31 TaxID=2917758 RepID=UPI001EF653D3|nr:pseudaminic acid cytidylyltransferase [Psychrobium sp. MM17-31]MCG7530100.1 pseudaminic acid cytidylyltransferase [Psychrobium sp. MM17-31]